MESAAAFGSIFTGGGGAPMIFSRRRRRHKNTGGGGVRRRQTIYKKFIRTLYGGNTRRILYSHPVYYTSNQINQIKYI